MVTAWQNQSKPNPAIHALFAYNRVAEESPQLPDLTAVQDARGPDDPASAPHYNAMSGCPLFSRVDYHMPTLLPSTSDLAHASLRKQRALC